MAGSSSLTFRLFGEDVSASRALDKVGAKAEETSARFGKLGAAGGAALAGLAVAAGAVGAASVKMAMDFDQQMTRIGTMANVPKAQLKGLSDGVLNLAGQVGFSPKSLAEALYMTESSFQSMHLRGFNALDALKVAAKGAAIGGSDLLTTTQALDALLASGAVKIGDYQGAMSALLATAGSGEMTMQDLVDSFNGMQAIGKSFGVSLADMSAALATFGDNNIRGADAGTAFRMALLALANPVKAGKAALDQLGIGATGLAKDMQEGGLNKALTDLHDHLDKAGITGSKVGEFMATTFGKKVGVGLGVLMQDLGRFQSKYADYQSQITSDAFQRKWAAQQAQFSQQLKNLEYGAEALGIRLGNFLIPQIQKFGKAVGDAWHSLNQQAGGQQSILKEFLTGFHNPGMTNFDSGFGGALEHIGVAAQHLGVQARQLWQQLATGLKPVFHDIGAFLSQSLIPSLQNLWTAVGPTLKAAVHDLTNVLHAWWDVMANAVGPALQAITGWMADHKQAVHDFAVVVGGMLLVWKGYTVWVDAKKAADALAASIQVLRTESALGLKFTFLAGVTLGFYEAWKSSQVFREGFYLLFHDIIKMGDGILVAFKGVVDGIYSMVIGILHATSFLGKWDPLKGVRKGVEQTKAQMDRDFEGMIQGADHMASHYLSMSRGIDDSNHRSIVTTDALKKSIDGLPNKTIIVSVIDHAKSILDDIHNAAAGLINLGFTPQGATNTIKAGNFASGGRVTGPGGPREDRVPIMASNGEFVVNAAATSRNLGLLHAINAQHFADGGLVYDVTSTVQNMGNALHSGMGPGGGASGNVASWAPVILAALAMDRLPASWLSAELRLMGLESGGNPTIQNPILVLGQHATGLFQMLPSTFASWMVPGHGNINSGFDNALSSFRYQAATYGSPFNIPGLYSGHYGGYAMGGMASGWARVGEAGPELVYLGRGGRVMSNRDSTGGGGQVIVNITGPVYSDSAGIKRLMSEIDREIARSGNNVPATFRR